MRKEVIITNNKAVTDDSIRILNEFQDKANRNVLAKIDLSVNDFYFNYVVMETGDIRDWGKINLWLCFNLNGKEYKFNKSVDDAGIQLSSILDYRDWLESDKELKKWTMMIISEKIAEFLMDRQSNVIQIKVK